jgi:uncharacterized membrane protein (DUF373 family)
MNRQAKQRPQTWGELRHEWGVLSVYQRFEALIGFVLTFVIGAVIVVALYRLIISVVEVLVLKSLNPLEHSVFQQVFGEIMTLLIALEFNHTLHHVITGERGIIHTRMVILIAELALARKIIVTDLFASSPASTLTLAFLMLALGVTYWLMREREDRMADEAVEP